MLFIYVIIMLIMLLIIYFTFFYDNIQIIELTKKDFKKYNDKIKKFEKILGNWYPLGDDYFKIDHGKDYLNFFNCLGKPIGMLCLNKNNNVIGIGISILRNIKTKYNSKKCSKVFYLCDLKIHPDYRGNHLPFKMLLKGLKYYNISNKAYGITMNNNDNNKKNKVVRLAQKIPIKFNIGGELMIYSLDYDEILKAIPIIIKNRGNIYFKSLSGIKDIILKSTNQPMNILHVQYYNLVTHQLPSMNFKFEPNPQKNSKHMFCCLKNDIMYYQLNKINIFTNVSATIIHYNMHDSDWKFITTADI